MKKAIFNSYDFIDLRKDLVQKTIGLLVWFCFTGILIC
jgi:hypothetical protein